MRRFVALVLVLLGVFAFAACGKKEEQAMAPAVEPAPVAAPAEQAPVEAAPAEAPAEAPAVK